MPITLENLSILLGREVVTSSRHMGWDLSAIPPARIVLIVIGVDNNVVCKDSWRVIKERMEEVMKVTVANDDDPH